MLTYLGNPQLKADFLAQIAAHEAADAIIKGTYGKMNGSFRGCAIGCALHSLNVLAGIPDEDRETGDHARFPRELGLPIWFAYLEDNIFERLPDALAKTWPRRIAEALPVGAAVTDIALAKILRWSLADAQFGVRHATDNIDVRAAIDGVIAGFDAEIAGTATAETRERANAAAWDARDARAARAVWAAWAARDARAVWDARDASGAWDARDARAAFYSALSEFVIATVRELEPVQ